MEAPRRMAWAVGLTSVMLTATLLGAPEGGASTEVVRQETKRFGPLPLPVDTPEEAAGLLLFYPQAGDRSIDVLVENDQGAHATAAVRFCDVGCGAYPAGGFCDRQSFDIPPGTQVIEVLVDPYWRLEGTQCTPAQVTGRVTVSFRDEPLPPLPRTEFAQYAGPALVSQYPYCSGGVLLAPLFWCSPLSRGESAMEIALIDASGMKAPAKWYASGGAYDAQGTVCGEENVQLPSGTRVVYIFLVTYAYQDPLGCVGNGGWTFGALRVRFT